MYSQEEIKFKVWHIYNSDQTYKIPNNKFMKIYIRLLQRNLWNWEILERTKHMEIENIFIGWNFYILDKKFSPAV